MSKPLIFADHPMTFPVCTEYRAVCDRVIDGDTIGVFIDVGLFEYPYKTIRIEGIDTSEIHFAKTQEERDHGLIAKKFLTDLLMINPQIKLITTEKISLNRLVARVYWFDKRIGLWINVADTLRENKLEKIKED